MKNVKYFFLIILFLLKVEISKQTKFKKDVSFSHITNKLIFLH